MREQHVSERMGELLKHIYVPETIARTIVNSLQADLNCAERKRQEQLVALQNESLHCAHARTNFTSTNSMAKSRRNSRSEEHTSELQSRGHLVYRLLLEK